MQSKIQTLSPSGKRVIIKKRLSGRSLYTRIALRKLSGFLYITPWLAGFLLLTLYPFLTSLWYSFTEYDILSDPSFTGLKNYIHIFTKNDVFYKSLWVTAKYVFFSVPGKLIFALFVAILLHQKLRFINFFRTIYYIPSIFGGSVAIAVLWRFLFMKDGVVNNLLSIVNIEPVHWLGDPGNALFTIILIPIWEFGSAMVLFLAGLKQIPNELYEAARVDGAGKTRAFIRITLPMLSPIILFNLVMQTINAFQKFTTAFMVTGGGPLRSTYLYSLMLYDYAFRDLEMGYASALSWILFIIIISLTMLIFKSSPLWTHYSDGRK
jgi:oligogalacturonide transport system permease protein